MVPLRSRVRTPNRSSTALDEQSFEQLVAAGIDAIPDQFAAKLSNVAITVADEPNELQRQKVHLRGDWTLFGLYEGVPQNRRGGGYSGALPDKITIFRGPIERASRGPEDVQEIVKNTIWHEVAHHFGMDEAAVRAAEAKRRERINQVN